MTLNPADTAAFIDTLRAQLPVDVLRDPEQRYLEEPRGRYAGQGGVLALPRSTEEVAILIRAAHAAWQAAPDHLVDAYGIARRNYYFRLADRRPASRKYARSRTGGKGGWIRRAEEFIAPRYHMSEADFARRVAQWG